MPTADPLDEIKRLYYAATKASIDRDLARAVELLKAMPTEDDRERAAVYMDGLSQMRSEWGGPRRPDATGPSASRGSGRGRRRPGR